MKKFLFLGSLFTISGIVLYYTMQGKNQPPNVPPKGEEIRPFLCL